MFRMRDHGLLGATATVFSSHRASTVRGISLSSCTARCQAFAMVSLLLSAPVHEAAAQLTWRSPAARVQGWQEDLDSATVAFLGRDRSFDAAARAGFLRDIHLLRDSVLGMTDEELIVRLATAVAGAHNAHTRLYLLRNRTVLRRYPVRVWWFGNELVIVRAHPEYADLVGSTILTIAGRPVVDVVKKVAPLYAANESWGRYMSAYLLTSPEILKGVGVQSGDELELTVEMPDHRRRIVRFPPLPLERSDQPYEAWWDLSPTHPGRQGPWVSAVSADSAHLPLYLRRLSQFYWMERIPASNVLYVQYNRAQDQPDRETVHTFGDRVLQELERNPHQRLVLDLRFNTGGNLELAEPLFRRIATLAMARERGRLFVITGRATFSAGITPVALLRQLTRTVIVGEPVGDELDYWSEGGNIVLPNTGLTLHYADGFHSYSSREYPAFRPYHHDLSVDDLTPDVPVETARTQYLAGVDPAMEAVLGFRP
jgi:hypothetical protein